MCSGSLPDFFSEWCSSLRELAANALYALTPRLPDYIKESGIIICALHIHMYNNCLHIIAVLPSLLSLVMTSDPRLRHGALHAVADVTTSLHRLLCSPSHSLSAVLGEGIVQQLVDIVPQVVPAPH